MDDLLTGVGSAPAPREPQRQSRGLVFRLYTSNPFYVISADLVFVGLRMSFDTHGKAFETWALMLGLVAYTALLAATACWLIRRAGVWDDARSLLLLVVMMVVRYGFGSDLALGGPDGFISLLPHVADPNLEPEKALWWSAGTVNLSTIILIVHGWFYVLYLFIDFVLWRLVRYSFGYFLLVALGGVIPFLSFFFEWRVPRDIRARLAALESSAAEGASA